jgi:peptidyl-prolyl cis-trans isomerase A (cyclophilin A)
LPDSATSQFYFNVVDNVAGTTAPPPATNLDYNPAQSGKSGYAVFGKVIAGMENIDKIAKLPKVAAKPERPVDTTVTYWIEKVK